MEIGLTPDDGVVVAVTAKLCSHRGLSTFLYRQKGNLQIIGLPSPGHMGAETDWNGRYNNAKQRLLSDPAIRAPNRRLFACFFEEHEYKLKRINNLRTLDAATFKTLYAYLQRFKNVNRWFRNKPLTQLTKSDIKQVYDALEDGVIVNEKGQLPRASETTTQRSSKARASGWQAKIRWPEN